MKKIYFVFIALLVLLGEGLFAQGSLQFNQVIHLEIETIIPNGANPNDYPIDTNIVIPANKVWKIESIAAGEEVVGFPKPRVLSGAPLVFLNKSLLYGNTSAAKLPFWLPAGTHNFYFFWGGSNPNVDTRCNWRLSIIEFNIIP